MRPEVLVKKLSESAKMPFYACIGDAGMDLSANENHVIKPGESALVKTGIAIAVGTGYEAQVRPRSGLAYKNQVTVLNTPGTIDSGYRGEVGVILINHGKSDFEVRAGDRIAQIVINKVESAEIVEVDDLDDTERGTGGFGSTGVGNGGEKC